MAQASAEKLLSILGLLRWKEWPWYHRERAVGKYVRAAFARRKRNRAVCPEYQIVWWEKDSQAEREPHLGERGGSEREHGEERMDFTVKESRFQGGKRG